MHLGDQEREYRIVRRSKRGSLRGVVAILATFALVLAACGGDDDAAPADPGTPSAPDPGSATPSDDDVLPVLQGLSDEDRAYVEDLIEQARGESGELLINWQSYDDIMPDWEAGFNEMYGLDVSIVHTPNPDGSGASAQITEEVGAGRTPHSDIIQGLNARLNNSIKAGTPIEYGDSWLHLPHINPESLEANGQVVINLHVIPGITYNTETVAPEDVPQNAWDVINNGLLEKYAVAATPTASLVDSLFTGIVDQEVWGWDNACDYTRALGQGVAGLINSGEIERIASGEFDMLVFATGQNTAVLTQQGAPVEMAYLADALFLRPGYLAIPKGAANEATARLFIDYLLSPGAQEILWNTYYIDSIHIEGSRQAPRVQAILDSGQEPALMDIAMMETLTPEADEHLEFVARELIRGADADCGSAADFGM